MEHFLMKVVVNMKFISNSSTYMPAHGPRLWTTAKTMEIIGIYSRSATQSEMNNMKKRNSFRNAQNITFWSIQPILLATVKWLLHLFFF